MTNNPIPNNSNNYIILFVDFNSVAQVIYASSAQEFYSATLKNFQNTFHDLSQAVKQNYLIWRSARE